MIAASPLRGIAVIGTNRFGQGVVHGTRHNRLPSVDAALAWCDEQGLQVLNRPEAQAIVDADQLLAQVAPF